MAASVSDAGAFFYRGARPLVLASASPRRRALLDSVRAAVRIVEPRVVESAPHLDPEAEVVNRALAKAEEVAGRLEGEALVIGADTLVVLDGAPFGKPSDPEHAVRILVALSGREHLVMTGVAVVDARHRTHRISRETTAVRMRRYDEAEARAYVATGEPLDKAGAYGIQGLGGLLVEGIRGDYANVVGLPLGLLRRLLLASEGDRGDPDGDARRP